MLPQLDHHQHNLKNSSTKANVPPKTMTMPQQYDKDNFAILASKVAAPFARQLSVKWTDIAHAETSVPCVLF